MTLPTASQEVDINSVILSEAEPEDTAPSITLPSPFSSEIEFGYLAYTGNSDSRAINARIAGGYTSGRYRSSAEWRFYNLYKDGEEDKRQSTYDTQSDYKLGPKTYLYGSYKGVDSRYTAYFKDHTFSGGLGYQFSNTDTFILEFELGPGFRYQEPNLEEIDDDDIIFPEIVKEAIYRGNVNTVWQALPSLKLSADITVVSGQSNRRMDYDLSMINDITESIALKLAYNRQHHDKVPDGLSQSDSMVSVNLLFVF
ncbi:hypothetical protein BCU68_14310 [Vibrio sp. 10N.286.49.B3]|uniref:DUF481 domain-containing protein n=1 Tax=Vibrio sp. 10N.286.49.B3 TaxID=1880855 RepID=UPI000C825386|nr:DUF481 domain-containing protein [Vibrio sp. 10N.286.49.B3]PMH42382.1 hypothetical protein BCU68_14310 [Vibrio sp. 10N.286.49.B3]